MKVSKKRIIPLKSMMGGALLSIFVVGFLVMDMILLVNRMYNVLGFVDMGPGAIGGELRCPITSSWEVTCLHVLRS